MIHSKVIIQFGNLSNLIGIVWDVPVFPIMEKENNKI